MPVSALNDDNTKISDIVHNEELVNVSSQEALTPLPPSAEKPSIPTVTRLFILDIPIFLVYFAITSTSTVFQNQLLYQSCRVAFDYSEADCEPLLGVTAYNANTTTIEDVVQPYVARVLMTRSLIESLIPAFISLFIGPWTDKYGRRTAILVSLSGLLISYIVSCIIAGISLITPVSPYVYIVSSIPYALCGGTCALMTVVYAYITDVAAEDKIVVRMFLNDAALGFGSVAGNFLSSPVFVVTNMATIFGISAAALLGALIYAIVYTVDILNVSRATIKERLRAFFQWHLFMVSLACAFKERSNLVRSFIWITMSSLVMVNFVSAGEDNVFYLFVRKRFQLSIDDYTTYNSIGIGIQVVSGFIGVILFRRILKFPIVLVAVIALMCYLMQSITRAAATQWWQLYLASGLASMSGLTNAMLYAILSHLVTANEIGKIFALTNSMTTVAPLVSSPIYTSVYNATLGYYPGFFNIISAVLYLICVLLMGSMYIVRKTKGFSQI